MKKIALITTGGTISMKSNEFGLAEPKAKGIELLGSIPKFNNIVIRDFNFRNVPGAHITHKDLVELRELIINLEDDGFNGIVITHGTDTMEETAYFLELTTDVGIPIVLTGAQRNLSALSSDFALNIKDSLLVASNEDTSNYGVVIVFASEIILAREAIKTHKSKVTTFKSLDFGPIGRIDNERVLWFRKPIIKEKYGLGNFESLRVDIIQSHLGSDSRIIKHSINDNVDGIILQGLGAGHVPHTMIEGIKESINLSIPVILTSRVLEGRLFTETYGFVGSEKYLRDIGVILGDDLPSQKARIKLMVLLSLGYTYEKIKYEFEKNCYI